MHDSCLRYSYKSFYATMLNNKSVDMETEDWESQRTGNLIEYLDFSSIFHYMPTVEGRIAGI